MAAFIVAVRGTVTQAVLLGVATTISHTLIVWIVVLGGMYLWQGVNAESFEPYLQLASAAIIIAIAIWMLTRTWQERQRARAASGAHDHGHDHHDHGHGHGEDIRRIDTGHGVIAVHIFDDSVPPRWHIGTERGHAWSAKHVVVTTERPNGARQAFAFVDRGAYLESLDEVPEPHEFMVRVSLGHGGHSHDYDLSFVEDQPHIGENCSLERGAPRPTAVHRSSTLRELSY